MVDADVEGPIRFPDFAGLPEGADLQNLSVMLCDPRRPATVVPGRGQHRAGSSCCCPAKTSRGMMPAERGATR